MQFISCRSIVRLQMLHQVLGVSADEADQLIQVVDKFQTVSPVHGATPPRVHFTTDASPAAAITIVDFLGCFECRIVKLSDVVVNAAIDGNAAATAAAATIVGKHCQSSLMAFLRPALSESKKKRLGLYTLTPGNCIRWQNTTSHDFLLTY